jgi:uncharacterized protein (DUF2141 family)
MRFVPLALLATLPLLIGNTSGSLSVTVTSIKNTKGQLIACLWKEKSSFPTCAKNKSVVRKKLAISGGTMTVSFPNVAPGTYAVTVEHDEDSDGKLKTNIIGMPKEGVGVSNNPGGIPSWSKALVKVSGNGAISVKMRYL